MQSIFQKLQTQPELIQFVRYHPIWYRYLMRDPSMIHELPKVAKKYYGKTIQQRIESFNHHLRMVDMFIQLTKGIKD